jgi:hypothetical protein
MRTLIAGSKDIDNIRIIQKAIEASRFRINEVVSGTGRGAAHLGEQWARRRGLSVRRIEPDRQRAGQVSAAERARELIRHADALIVIWDGRNQEMLKLINRARSRGLKVHVHRLA